MHHAIRALLVTDIVDSTALVETLGDWRAAEVNAVVDRAARELLTAHRGLEIDRTDGFLLMFESSADAARYAQAYHSVLAEVSVREGVKLSARVGLHFGEMVLRTNDPEHVARGAKPLEVEGMAKPIAARVMSVAKGGQTLVTPAARDALEDAVPTWLPGERADTMGLVTLGHWQLKGVSEPIELFDLGTGAPIIPRETDKVWEVTWRQDTWLPVTEIPSNLPQERDGFFGREDDLSAVSDAFVRGASLVTLQGSPGAGKTRLVKRFGWSTIRSWRGGVWFCDLRDARDPSGICAAIATTFRVSLGAGNPVDSIANTLATRPGALVILDNFEQVARHADETLGVWLDAASDCVFLVTTREVLGVRGEQIISLPPLATPRQLASTLAEAQTLPSVALFVARAHAARQDFDPSDADAEVLCELIRQLDGLPLAIELAAARVRTMSLQQIVARMGSRFRLLGGGRRDRRATLRAAVDESWDLLDVTQRSAFTQLSVFEAAFTTEAAEAVIDSHDPDVWVVDVLQELVDRSLLIADGQGQFRLLVSLRDYAIEKLEAGSTSAVRLRHARYFVGHDASAREAPDVRVAFSWSVEQGHVVLATDLLSPIQKLAYRVGPFDEASRQVSRLVELPNLPPELLARALTVRSALRHRTGDIPGSLLDSDAAMQLVPEESSLRATLLVNRGNVFSERGEHARADDSYEAARQLAIRLGDEPLQQTCIRQMAVSTVRQQRYREALRLMLSTLNEADPGGLWNAVALCVHLERYDEARLLALRAISASQAASNLRALATGDAVMAGFAAREGDPSRARALLDSARRRALVLGEKRQIAILEVEALGVYVGLGDADAVRASADLVLASDPGWGFHPSAIQGQAELALQQGQFEKAGQMFADVKDLLAGHDRLHVVCREARAAAGGERRSQARALLAEADEIAARLVEEPVPSVARMLVALRKDTSAWE